MESLKALRGFCFVFFLFSDLGIPAHVIAMFTDKQKDPQARYFLEDLIRLEQKDTAAENTTHSCMLMGHGFKVKIWFEHMCVCTVQLVVWSFFSQDTSCDKHAFPDARSEVRHGGGRGGKRRKGEENLMKGTPTKS